MLNVKKVGLIALLAMVTGSELFAGTLVSPSTGDLLICFRKSGGANDLVVDAGPLSTYSNAVPGQVITITQFTTNQLYRVGLNSLIFSGFTFLNDNTLVITKPRSTLTQQTPAYSAPLTRKNSSSQANTAGDMGSILTGAGTCRNLFQAPTNSDTCVLEPDDSGNTDPAYTSGQSYNGTMGAGNNFNGDFGAIPEKTCPSTFVTGSTVVRSDLYVIPPTESSLAVKFLGYLELNTNGIMTFVAPVITPTVPVIRNIGRTNTVTSVTFSSGTFGTYTLRGTNGISGFQTPRTNWPAITSQLGNGGNLILQDTTTAANKFYVITAQ